MAVRYNVISGDSHLEFSPEKWTPHVPAKWRDRAPRRVTLPNGGDGIVMEGRTTYVLGLAVTGKPYEQHRLDGIRYEGSPGTGSPEQRVREQDMDGVDAEIIFTSVSQPHTWRGLADDEGYRALIHGYNEFLCDEYCAAAPDRLLAMGVIPVTGVDDAIAEMEYCQQRGLKGISLLAFPSGKGYPTPEDDRFWRAALDMHMPVAAHIGLRLRAEGPLFKYAREPKMQLGFGSDPIGVLTRFGNSATQDIIQLIFAGVFDRFPELRIYKAETMIGWLPYQLEQTDDIWERSRHWAADYYGLESPPKPPSHYIREHVLWGFLRDPFGVQHRHAVGVKHALWGSDFPHSAGDWPDSKRVLTELFADVPDDERYAMVAGNAVDFFRLDNEF